MLNNACLPDKPTDKSYAKIIQLMRNYAIELPASVFAERRKFYQEKQEKNETITDWCERLRKLAMKC